MPVLPWVRVHRRAAQLIQHGNSNMKIRVFKSGEQWRADPVDLPGTPPNGTGISPFEALGSLLWRIACEWDTWGKYWNLYELDIEGYGTPAQWLEDCVSGTRKDNSMGQQIIKQPNGLFALWSTVVDDFVLLDAEPSDLVDHFTERARRMFVTDVERVVKTLNEGGRPYYQFTKSFDDCIARIRELHGTNTESLRMIQELAPTVPQTITAPEPLPESEASQIQR